ncbi:hypothetical protein EDD22DRAFT_849664 [Suillus occidentalis]|nr:hypothetical protein EDD22DRAFT_849664 [Suillus occidentalis]
MDENPIASEQESKACVASEQEAGSDSVCSESKAMESRIAGRQHCNTLNGRAFVALSLPYIIRYGAVQGIIKNANIEPLVLGELVAPFMTHESCVAKEDFLPSWKHPALVEARLRQVKLPPREVLVLYGFLGGFELRATIPSTLAKLRASSHRFAATALAELPWLNILHALRLLNAILRWARDYDVRHGNLDIEVVRLRFLLSSVAFHAFLWFAGFVFLWSLPHLNMLLAFETPTPLPFGAEAPTGPEGLPPKAGDGMWEQKPPQDQKVYIPKSRRRDVGAEAPTGPEGPEGLPPTIGDGMWEQKPPQDQKVYIPKSRRRDVGAEAPTGPEGLPPTIGDGMWEQKPPQDQKVYIPKSRRRDVGAEAPTGPEGLPPNAGDGKTRRSISPKAGDGMWEQKPPQDQKVYLHYRRRDVGAEAPTGPEGLPPTIGDGMWGQKPPQDQKVYIPKSRRRDVGAEAPTGPEGLPPNAGDGKWEQKLPQGQIATIPAYGYGVTEEASLGKADASWTEFTSHIASGLVYAQSNVAKEFVAWFNSGAWTTIPFEALLPAVHAVLSSLDVDAIELTKIAKHGIKAKADLCRTSIDRHRAEPIYWYRCSWYWHCVTAALTPQASDSMSVLSQFKRRKWCLGELPDGHGFPAILPIAPIIVILLDHVQLQTYILQPIQRTHDQRPLPEAHLAKLLLPT